MENKWRKPPGCKKTEDYLLNEKIMKRKKLEEMLFIKGDIFSDDELSLTAEEKKGIALVKMSAAAKAKAMKEAEMAKIKKKGQEIQVSESEESETESEDLTDTGSEDIDESFDENDDSDAQIRALLETAKAETTKLQAKHRKFAGDYNRSDEDTTKPAGKTQKPSDRMAGGDAANVSQPRHSMRLKNQKHHEVDEEEDAFIQRLKQKEKELKEKYKIDKIPFLNDPMLKNTKSSVVDYSSSESSSDTEDPTEKRLDKIMGEMAKANKPLGGAAKASSSVTKKAPVGSLKKPPADIEAVMKKKFESLKKLLPPKTDEIESMLKKMKKPGNDWASSQEKQISKKLDQIRSTPSSGKAKLPITPSAAAGGSRPTARVDSASATRGRAAAAAAALSNTTPTSTARRKSPRVVAGKKPTAAVAAAATTTTAATTNRQTPAGKKSASTAHHRLSDLDSVPVRDLSTDVKKMLSSSLTERMVLRSGKKLESKK